MEDYLNALSSELPKEELRTSSENGVGFKRLLEL